MIYGRVTLADDSVSEFQPSALGEVLSADWQATLHAWNSNASWKARADSYDAHIDRVKSLTGVQLDNPLTSTATREDYEAAYEEFDRDRGLFFSYSRLWAAQERNFGRALEKLAQQHPEMRAELVPQKSFEELARELARASEEHAARVFERADQGVGRWAARFAGGFIGGLQDPVNVAALALGPWSKVGQGAAAVVWNAVKVGAVNAGVEVASQPIVQAWRKEAGLPYGLDIAATSVGLAFTLGFGLDAGVRGLYRGGKRLIAPTTPGRPGTAAGAPGDSPPAEAAAPPPRGPETPESALEGASGRLPADHPVRKAAEGDAAALREMAEKTGVVDDPAVRGALDEYERYKLFGSPPDVEDGEHALRLAEAIRRSMDGAAPPPGAAKAAPAPSRAWPDLGEDVTTVPQTVDGKPVHFRPLDGKRMTLDPEALNPRRGGTGVAVAFERADGTFAVQRLGRAKRLEELGPAPEAYVFREADGWTQDDARVFAARQNLLEASGSPVDMAAILRARPELADRSLPLSEYKFKQAQGLAALSEEAFAMVAGGEIAPQHAFVVGELPDQARHAGLLRDMIAAGVKSRQQASLFLGQALVGEGVVRAQETTFGVGAPPVALLGERTRVLDQAVKLLAADKRIFSMLDREAAKIERAGNVLDRDENVIRAELAKKLGELVAALARTPSRVSDLLEEAARSVGHGVKPRTAASAFVRRVAAILDEEGVEGLARRPARPTDLAPTKMDDPFGPEAKAQADELARVAAAEPAPRPWTPDEVETLIGMWRFVQETRKIRPPQRLVDFLRERGGVIYDGGDVRNMLGGARGRPGLVSSQGQTLDDAALRAWEAGFFATGERPTINDLLDAIDEDLRGDPVVRVNDYDTLETIVQAREAENELDQLGIAAARTEAEARAILGQLGEADASGKAGAQGQERASDPQRPGAARKADDPLTEPATKSAEEILAERAARRAAEPQGESTEDAFKRLQQAMAARVKREAGDDEPPFSLADAEGWRKADADVRARRTVRIAPEIQKAAFEELRRVTGATPPGIIVGVLARVEPESAGEVRAIFKAEDGSEFFVVTNWDDLHTARASYLPDTRAIAFFNYDVESSVGLIPVYWHELVHALRSEAILPDDVWSRLVRHATDDLGMLEAGFTVGGQRTTIRDYYTRTYRRYGRDLQELLDQEAVAHMVEYIARGAFDAEDFMPIAGDVLAILGRGAQQKKPARRLPPPRAANEGEARPTGDLIAEDSIARIGTGEFATPTARELAAAITAVRAAELEAMTKFFGGDRAKAERFIRLQRRADSVGGLEADKIEVEIAALRREATGPDEWPPLADTYVLHDLERTFDDIEQSPGDVAHIVQRYLSDLPRAEKRWTDWDLREASAMAVMRKAGQAVAESGLNRQDVTREILSRYRRQFSDPADARFMEEVLGQAMRGRRALPAPDEQPLFAFAGRFAKNADLRALDQAQAMERAGTWNAFQVRAATGWERGAEAEWKFELSDREAKLIGEADRVAKRKAVGPVSGKLSEIVDNPLVFEAYPELKDYTITIEQNHGRGRPRAFIDLDKKSIWVRAGSAVAAIRKIVHELQHAIQRIEFWAEGGDALFELELLRAATRDIDEQAAALLEQIAVVTRGYVEGRPPDAKDAAALFQRLDALRAEREKIDKTSFVAQHRRQAGEVEARNVERRLKMRGDERRVTMMWETEDILRGDQIRRRDGPSRQAGDEDDWELDWYDQLSRRSAGIEAAKERAEARRVVQTSEKTALERDAEKLFRDLQKLEHELRDKGWDAPAIAAEIERLHGFKVDPEDIARRTAWWHIETLLRGEAGASGLRWSAEERATAAKLWREGKTAREVGEEMAGRFGRRVTIGGMSAQLKALGIAGDRGKASRLIFTPERNARLKELVEERVGPTLERRGARRAAVQEWVKQTLADSGMTQRKFAKAAGVDEGNLTSMLAGRVSFGPKALARIADRFGGEPPSPAKRFGRDDFGEFARELAALPGKKITARQVEDQARRLGLMGERKPRGARLGNPWSPEALRLVASEEAANLSIQEIADLLSRRTGAEFTRGAVAGKLMRLRDNRLRAEGDAEVERTKALGNLAKSCTK